LTVLSPGFDGFVFLSPMGVDLCLRVGGMPSLTSSERPTHREIKRDLRCNNRCEAHIGKVRPTLRHRTPGGAAGKEIFDAFQML